MHVVHAVYHGTALLAASSSTSLPFNVDGITNFLTSLLGLGVIAIGGIAIFRAAGQQAHRHAMSMVAVVLVGLVIAGIALTGNASDFAKSLAHLFIR